jgi:hypothetical protein
MRLEGAQQMAGLAESGEHEDLAAGKLTVEFIGRGQAIKAWQIYVENGHVGLCSEGGVNHLVAAFEFSDDLDILL